MPKSVGPAMILATQDIFAAAAESDGPGAMAANVAEGAQRAFLVANNDDGFASDIGGEKTFGIGDGALHAVYFAAGLGERSDELPGALKDARFLDFQNGGIGVKTRGECLGAPDLFVDVEMKGFRLHKSNVKSSKSKNYFYFLLLRQGGLASGLAFCSCRKSWS
jgi:hypothetical protein